MFDPQDELYSLTRRFEQHGGRQILSQVSQISLLLQRYNNTVSVAIDGISQQMGLIYRETVETSRHMSAMAKKLNTGSDISNQISNDRPCDNYIQVNPGRDGRLEAVAQGATGHRRRFHKIQITKNAWNL